MLIATEHLSGCHTLNKGFIRGLWGTLGLFNNRWEARRTKIANDIKLVQSCKYDVTDMAYIFGEDNYKQLVDMGFKCKLVDKKPIVWDLTKENFRHKLEIFEQAAKDFDEYIFLDWDCVRTKELPLDFWEVMNKKSKIQASLSMYNKMKVFWRPKDWRKVPCASFVYFREKNIASEIIKVWETMTDKWSEEVSMAKYMDSLMPNGFNEADYKEMFEPDFFISPMQPPKMFLEPMVKNIVYTHFNCRAVTNFLTNKQGWQK